jgi:hypothetical protein
MQTAFEDVLKVFFLGYWFHCQHQCLLGAYREQQQRLQEQQQCQSSISTSTQTKPAVFPSSSTSIWTAADLNEIEQAEQASRQALEQQGQAKEDTPAISPKLENIEMDLQNDSDIYTETFKRGDTILRYTDLTRRADGQTRRRPDMQANEQAAEQTDAQTDVQADEQLEEQTTWLTSMIAENEYWKFIREQMASRLAK